MKFLDMSLEELIFILNDSSYHFCKARIRFLRDLQVHIEPDLSSTPPYQNLVLSSLSSPPLPISLLPLTHLIYSHDYHMWTPHTHDKTPNPPHSLSKYLRSPLFHVFFLVLSPLSFFQHLSLIGLLISSSFFLSSFSSPLFLLLSPQGQGGVESIFVVERELYGCDCARAHTP